MAHCIVGTSGKFTAEVNNTGGHLFPEIYIVPKKGKFAASFNDASG
jgi:hypothetical protein